MVEDVAKEYEDVGVFCLKAVEKSAGAGGAAVNVGCNQIFHEGVSFLVERGLNGVFIFMWAELEYQQNGKDDEGAEHEVHRCKAKVVAEYSG